MNQGRKKMIYVRGAENFDVKCERRRREKLLGGLGACPPENVEI